MKDASQDRFNVPVILQSPLKYLLALFTLCGSFCMGDVVIFLGPPGSGKGTQAENLRKEFSLDHISTGDMIRGYLRENPGSPLAIEMKGYTEKGELVPDKIIVGILQERLQKNGPDKGVLLDGFPRTVPQAEALDKLLNGQKILVINFDIADQKVIERLSGRLTCSNCQTIYNQKTNPPKQEGVCDVCGGKVIQRKDDQLDTIMNRLEVYKKETQPLIQYYQKKGVLKTINADQDKTVIEKQVTQSYKDAFISPN